MIAKAERNPYPPEAWVALAWQGRLSRGSLVTDGGVELQVVHPGRPNGDAGPDFRGAIIATARGELWRGDVEIHVRSSQWRAHGHHRDPGYNGVILHVVLVPDDGPGAVTEAGRPVPTL